MINPQQTFPQQDFQQGQQFPQQRQQQTYGQQSVGVKRVQSGINVNPEPLVNHIQQNCANLIDLCQQQISDVDQEADRLWRRAEDAFEEANMWALRAATTQRLRQVV